MPVGMIILLIGILLGAVGFFVYLGFEAEEHRKQVDAMHTEWDAGQGHPDAVKLRRPESGEATVEVSKTVPQVDSRWNTCIYKNCWAQEVRHFPTVYPFSSLLLDNGCYTVKPDTLVDHLMATATPGNVYRVTYSADGKKLTICAASHPNDNAKVIIWSDDPKAPR